MVLKIEDLIVLCERIQRNFDPEEASVVELEGNTIKIVSYSEEATNYINMCIDFYGLALKKFTTGIERMVKVDTKNLNGLRLLNAFWMLVSEKVIEIEIGQDMEVLEKPIPLQVISNKKDRVRWIQTLLVMRDEIITFEAVYDTDFNDFVLDVDKNLEEVEEEFNMIRPQSTKTRMIEAIREAQRLSTELPNQFDYRVRNTKMFLDTALMWLNQVRDGKERI